MHAASQFVTSVIQGVSAMWGGKILAFAIEIARFLALPLSVPVNLIGHLIPLLSDLRSFFRSALHLHSSRRRIINMDAISISAASGMRARLESLELLANNLANVETGGFKADREFYSLYTTADAAEDPRNGQYATLPVVESHWTDLRQGDLKNTGNPLDLALDGEGFFAAQTPQGVRYTRNGTFRISAAGQMTTGEGHPVLSKGGTPITLRPGLAIDIKPDGAVQQAGQPPSQLNVVNFDPRAVNKEGHNYFVAVSGATPRASTAAVHQGKLETSNVGAAESAVRLVAIMRQFEMLQRAAGVGNELNKRAMEEVARVTT